MKQYKTVKGLVNHLRKISDCQSFVDLKGFKDLTEEQQEELEFISGDISNFIGTFYEIEQLKLNENSVDERKELFNTNQKQLI